VILREPEYDDCELIASWYEQWPESRKGRIFPSDVRNWIVRFRYRADEKGLVGEVDGVPVGFIFYEPNLFVAKIYEIVIQKDLQGKGYGKAVWRALKDKLVKEGVVVAEFDALPGHIMNKTTRGDFIKVSEGTGPKTGLPIVTGRVTADMEV